MRFAALMAIPILCVAQVPAPRFDPQFAPQFDPRETFAPLTMPEPPNQYRSGGGAPGPAYWQNAADYEMHAALDTKTHQISNTETITYTNNSPDTLASLWLHLEQDTYREDARSKRMAGGANGRGGRGGRGGANGAPAQPNVTEGFVFESVEIETPAKGAVRKTPEFAAAHYIVNDERMQIRLDEPLKGHGGQTKIRIHYHYQVPGTWGGRTSWSTAKQGEIYDIAQWYPRMAVYDDIRGWDTLPYLGSEFYLEYGTFDYYINVPSDMIVAGGGELVNPKEVLTKTEIDRLAQARTSDKTVYIRTASEVADPASRPQQGGTLTWHFRMEHTRDVAWSASPSFIWDAAKMNLPDGKTSLAESVYPVEGAGADGWDRSTEYVKDTIERFSKHWYPYPWPTAISVGGFSSGMEYPGMVFDGFTSKGGGFFWLTAHEIGHTWFPMIVGSNERRNAFMDEGFNTFIDIEESAEFEGGKYGPKRDSEYSAGGEPPDTILPVLDNKNAPNILMRADAMPGNLTHPVRYFKGAYGMVLLREQILGPERFDWAFRKYIRDWAYKHPTPADFFRTMESEGGEDLSWFWRGWYMNNWRFDMSVDKIDGAQITISNRGKLVLPATVEAKFTDGTTARIKLPVETWLSKSTVVWTPPGGKTVQSAIVDPDHVLPDDDRKNNEKSN